jgi:hypothetical protein
VTAEAVLVLAGVVVLVAAVVLYVGGPLLGGAEALDPVDRRAVALLTEREALLATLRDLDADRASGRLGEADYQRLRAESVQRGVTILAALDSLAAETAGATATLSAGLEEEISRASGQAGAAAAGRYCPACGHACGPADSFCGGCGRPLPGDQQAPA